MFLRVNCFNNHSGKVSVSDAIGHWCAASLRPACGCCFLLLVLISGSWFHTNLTAFSSVAWQAQAFVRVCVLHAGGSIEARVGVAHIYLCKNGEGSHYGVSERWGKGCSQVLQKACCSQAEGVSVVCELERQHNTQLCFITSGGKRYMVASNQGS